MEKDIKKELNQARFLEEVLNQPTEKGTKEVKLTKQMEKDLQELCTMINRAAGTPIYSRVGGFFPEKDENGRTTPAIGHYKIGFAYGGVQLQQYVGDGGAIKNITSGFIPKRELWEKMQSFLSGISAGQ